MKLIKYSLLDLYKYLWFHVNKKIKLQMISVLFLSLFVSLTEFFSIASLLPFITIFTDIDKAISNDYFKYLISFFDLNTKQAIYTFSVIAFCSVVFIAMLSRVLLIVSKVRISNNLSAHLIQKMFYLSITQRYDNLLDLDLTDIISTLSIKANSIASALFSSIVDIVNAVFIIIFIMIGISYLNPSLSLIILISLGTIYSIIMIVIRRKLKVLNKNIVQLQTEVLKVLKNSFAGIKEVIIFELQQYYYKKFMRADSFLRYTIGTKSIISQLPRFIIEGIAIMTIAILVWYLVGDTNYIISNLAIIGTIIIGLQRLLPNFQTIYVSVVFMIATKLEIVESYNLLKQPINEITNVLDKEKLDSFNKLEFKNISFKYKTAQQYILKNINLKIKKGEKIAIIGPSGVGKSCLLDLMLGFLEPNEGSININGIKLSKLNILNWHRSISYVPQDVFLLNTSFIENIIFSSDTNLFDKNKLQNILTKCNLLTTVNSWPEGWFRVLGDRGNNISGGQKQRIGIARALYKESNIVFLDEATSALDSEIENVIMTNLTYDRPEMTVIAITHRPELLKYFDRIFKIEKQNLIEVI